MQERDEYSHNESHTTHGLRNTQFKSLNNQFNTVLLSSAYLLIKFYVT
jgi:hypothetical protein